MKTRTDSLRFWLVMTAVCALASLLFTVGLARRPHRVFAATYMTMNNPFYQVIHTELNKAVTARQDTLIVRDPLMNPEKQIEQVEGFIADHVDGIFVNPVDSVSLGPVLRRAQKAGIPVIAVDSTLKDDSMLASTVISDNYDAGRKCGEDLLKKTDSARIWLLRHSEAVSASDRIRGFLSVVENVPGYAVIGEAECEGQLEQAMPAMEELIRLQSDGTVVMALNDPSALGAIAALEEAGLDSVLVYGIDGTPDMKTRIAAYPDRYVSVAQSPISIGSIAAQTMYDCLAGKQVQHRIDVPVSLIDRDTIDGYSLTGVAVTMNTTAAMRRIREAMSAVSFLLVLCTAGVMLAGSIHILHIGDSASFLQSIPHAPKNPWYVFILCFVLAAVLTWFILNTTVVNRSGVLFYAGIKTLLACVIIWNLNLSCRSLLLLVFSDVLYTMRSFPARQMVVMGAILTGIYLFCSYDVITPMIPMVSVEAYYAVFERSISSVLAFLLSLLESTIMILFISFVCMFLFDLYQEKENIAQELNMVHRVNEDLRHYASMTEQIAETRERKRLAREIHDTLGHALTGIAAGIDATLVILDKNPDLAARQLHLVRQVVSEGIGDVRASLQKLRPGALEQRGLKGALEKMIGEFESVTAMNIFLNYQADSLDFDKAKEDVCFRLVQESITNARRHGGASTVTVLFEAANGWLHILIRDNGTGTGTEPVKYGYGLTQMEENVRSLHGTVRFDGTEGFVTEVRIPLEKGEYKDECDPRG